MIKHLTKEEEHEAISLNTKGWDELNNEECQRLTSLVIQAQLASVWEGIVLGVQARRKERNIHK